MRTLVFSPTYDGWRCNGESIFNLARQDSTIQFFEPRCSALTHSFNSCWAKALQERPNGATHFLMIHSDICPDSTIWFTRLHEIMQKHQAKVLSVMSPIKDGRGLTSTALDTDQWRPERLTLTQMNEYSPTWTSFRLLVNTGLLLVDMREDWVNKICFKVQDKIEVVDYGLHRRAEFIPEDWDFSRQCHLLDVHPFVTREITLSHRGEADFSTKNIWGWNYDKDNQKGNLDE